MCRSAMAERRFFTLGDWAVGGIARKRCSALWRRVVPGEIFNAVAFMWARFQSAPGRMGPTGAIFMHHYELTGAGRCRTVLFGGKFGLIGPAFRPPQRADIEDGDDEAAITC